MNMIPSQPPHTPPEVVDPKSNAGIMRACAFILEFRGYKFLALNAPLFDSQAFESLDKPETGHDALMSFYWDGKAWSFTLYHAAHRTNIDLSQIAKRYKGTGGMGACWFRTMQIPFPLYPQ
jgi:hypothetical protein